MGCPADDDLEQDTEIAHAAWRIYRFLRRHELDFRTPREVKLDLLVSKLHMSKTTVVESVNYLVEVGYLIEHQRAWRGIRQFTLAWNRGSKGSTALDHAG